MGESKRGVPWLGLIRDKVAVSLVESLFLDIVENEGESFSFFTIALNSDWGGSLDLSWFTFLVVLAMSEPCADVISMLDLDQRDVTTLGKGLYLQILEWDEILTVTSFLYLGSSQSSARTQRMACLRSRHLQTSLRPLTRPNKTMDSSGMCSIEMPSILVQILQLSSRG